jgi:hypothetical protein
VIVLNASLTKGWHSPKTSDIQKISRSEEVKANAQCRGSGARGDISEANTCSETSSCLSALCSNYLLRGSNDLPSCNCVNQHLMDVFLPPSYSAIATSRTHLWTVNKHLSLCLLTSPATSPFIPLVQHQFMTSEYKYSLHIL